MNENQNFTRPCAVCSGRRISSLLLAISSRDCSLFFLNFARHESHGVLKKKKEKKNKEKTLPLLTFHSLYRVAHSSFDSKTSIKLTGSSLDQYPSSVPHICRTRFL